jgi:aminomethyltransferase
MSSHAEPTPLKKTPLHAKHLAAGARMVEFAGWEMPVEYAGISEEHLAVRTRGGLFDVSHMGQLEIAGPDALPVIQWLTSNDASRLSVGQAQYSALTTPAGTFVDDILVYRLADEHYMLVVNGANIMKDFEWITAQASTRGGDAAVVNASSRYALLALQGPVATGVLQPLTGVDLAALKYYRFESGEVAGIRATISRTGYTGEDGFEIYVPPAAAERAWTALLDAGRDAGVIPCGLGARDTLRLEAGMRLCGSDMDEHTTVLEAGLGWIVGWKKDDFMGADVLRKQKADGPAAKLAAFEMSEPRTIARHGYPVLRGDDRVGVVTSGTFTPYLKKAIGFARVPSDMAEVGTTFDVEIRGRRAAATVVAEPFYKRAKSS